MDRQKSTTVRIVLHKYQPNKDGSYPLRIIITKNRKRIHVSTGHSVRKDQWDEVAEKVYNHPDKKWLNNFLLNRKSEIIRKAFASDNQTVTQIRNKVRKEGDGYFRFAFDWIERYNNPEQVGTFLGYKSILNKLKEFSGSDLELSDIDPTFIRRYETHLRKKGLAINTIGNHLKKMRAITNAAYLEKKLKERPFDHVKLTKARTVKQRLTPEELDLIRSKRLTPWSGMWHARNVFLLQFNIRGARIADILTIKEENIKNGRYNKQTRKDDEFMSISLNKEAQKIVDYYVIGKQDREIKSPFLITLIKEGDKKSLYRRIGNATAYVNKCLRQLTKSCGIDKHISSHSARHTYAEIGKRKIKDVHMMQQLLGHSSIAMTQSYLADLDGGELDVINDLITNNEK